MPTLCRIVCGITLPAEHLDCCEKSNPPPGGREALEKKKAEIRQKKEAVQ